MSNDLTDTRPPIRISEIFGPTLQGEGAQIGWPCIFVRVGMCDYACRWCDTKYAVDRKHLPEWVEHTAEEVVAKVKRLVPAGAGRKPLVVLSGGNPAIYDFTRVILQLQADGYKVTCETQGSISRNWFNLLDYLTISPKPPSSGNITPHETLIDCINHLHSGKRVHRFEDATIKVVVGNRADYEYAKDVATWVKKYHIYKLHIQPCNLNDHPCDSLDKMREVFEWIKEDQRNDFILLPQMHLLLWGPERGV